MIQFNVRDKLFTKTCYYMELLTIFTRKARFSRLKLFFPIILCSIRSSTVVVIASFFKVTS